MKHEFYLILADHDHLNDEVETLAFEAGFDDSLLTLRGNRVAIEVFDREGPLHETIISAIASAERAGLKVLQVTSPVSDTIGKINEDLIQGSSV